MKTVILDSMLENLLKLTPERSKTILLWALGGMWILGVAFISFDIYADDLRALQHPNLLLIVFYTAVGASMVLVFPFLWVRRGDWGGGALSAFISGSLSVFALSLEGLWFQLLSLPSFVLFLSSILFLQRIETSATMKEHSVKLNFVALLLIGWALFGLIFNDTGSASVAVFALIYTLAAVISFVLAFQARKQNKLTQALLISYIPFVILFCSFFTF